LKLLPPRKKSNWEVTLQLPMVWWDCSNCWEVSEFSLHVDFETSGSYSLNPRAISLYSLDNEQKGCWIYEIGYKEIVTEKFEGNKIRTIENELIAIFETDEYDCHSYSGYDYY